MSATSARSSTGTCELCGHQTSKAQMGRHLTKCAPAHDSQGPEETIARLRIDAAGEPTYWLQVEARADATLEQLDALLRHVWLECCGHMSAFRVGDREPSMGSRIGAVFGTAGTKFRYDYDFGSTTSLIGQVAGARTGRLGRVAARVLARNDPPKWKCVECDLPATIICPFCVYSGSCLFCDAHADQHPCAEEEVYLPVVNSPRMGVCGYSG